MILEFDSTILLWIQDVIRNPVLDPVFKTITHLGDGGVFWISLSLLLCVFKKTRKAGLFALFALLFSVIVNNAILKNLIGRIRPYEIIAGLECIIKHASDPSFPSGHTGSSLAAGTVFLKKLPKKFSIPLFIVAILISLSRLYVGIHYPTDVMAGAVTGAALGILACILGDFLLKKFREKKPELHDKIFENDEKETAEPQK
ncbi:MAG: phosphatase PAP2 family protein [Lachnospiraceae bacterium]|nr:phosphatase PAP2 family protein [Lachnospiraceae bacterium]